MFDYLNVDKKFFPQIKEIEENNYSLSNFQTKDFDNSLENYYVDENGNLFIEKVEYSFIENKETPKKGKWTPPFFQEEKSRTKIPYAFTGIVNAYDYLQDINNQKNEIFVSLDFKFFDGILQGIGIVRELKVIEYDIILQRKKDIEIIRAKKENDVLYKISFYLAMKILKIINILNKLYSFLISYSK